MQRHEQDQQPRTEDRHTDELTKMDHRPVHAPGVLGKHRPVIIGIFLRRVEKTHQQRQEFSEQEQGPCQAQRPVVRTDTLPPTWNVPA